MSLISVDINNESTRDIITRLSKRNKFEEDTIQLSLYGELPDSTVEQRARLNGLNVAKAIQNSRMYKTCILLSRQMQNQIMFCKFIVLPKLSKDGAEIGRKVVGFIFYNIKNDNESELLYILVDKEYRGRGFGKMLLSSYIEWIYTPENIKSVKVEISDKSVIPFYSKFGFCIKSNDTAKCKEKFITMTHKSKNLSFL